ncbi:MAG: methyltransferase domain-containing protein [Chloroflexota bacterium]
MYQSSSLTPPFLCPVCGSKFDGTIVAEETLPDESQVAVQVCPTCGLHITYPRLENPQEAYSDLDEASWNSKYGGIDAGRFKHDRHQNYLEEVATIQTYVPDGKILDVGCHSGWLLGYLQQAGYTELEGVEPTPFLASVARRRLNITIHEMYLQDLTDRDRAYDAIIATDVIEHVNPEDQPSFIGAIHKLLKPEGYVFIKTPNVHFTKLKANISSGLPEIINSHLLMHRDLWDAKEHVVLWDETTLRGIFQHNGFEIVRTFVPMPVQTRNSPILARIARDTLYTTSYLVGGRASIPPLAQDIFLVARKQTS